MRDKERTAKVRASINNSAMAAGHSWMLVPLQLLNSHESSDFRFITRTWYKSTASFTAWAASFLRMLMPESASNFRIALLNDGVANHGHLLFGLTFNGPWVVDDDRSHTNLLSIFDSAQCSERNQRMEVRDISPRSLCQLGGQHCDAQRAFEAKVVMESGRGLFIRLSIYLSVYRSLHQDIYLSTNQSIYLSIHRSLWLSIHLSIDLSSNLSVQSIHQQSIHPA